LIASSVQRTTDGTRRAVVLISAGKSIGAVVAVKLAACQRGSLQLRSARNGNRK
jgi:hypothetical protein